MNTLPLIGRDREVFLMDLAYVSASNALFVSEPGTAKTTMARMWAQSIGAKGSDFFAIQLASDTMREQLFGPWDIKALKEDNILKHVVDGMLPQATVAFIDEIFKAAKQVRDMLLTYFQDKQFRNPNLVRGNTRCILAASNEIPEGRDSETSSAFWDRFMIRHIMDPVPGVMRRQVREFARNRHAKGGAVSVPNRDLSDAVAMCPNVRMTDEVSEMYDQIAETLEINRIHISDRRYAEAERIVQASAALDGRVATQREDLEVLQYCFWTNRQNRSTVERTVLGVASPKKAMIQDAIADLFAKLESIKQDSSKPGGSLSAQERSLIIGNLTQFNIELRQFDRKVEDFDLPKKSHEEVKKQIRDMSRTTLNMLTNFGVNGTGEVR
jgi:MoxR-like ATPase